MIGTKMYGNLLSSHGKDHDRSGRPDKNRDHELKRGPTGRQSSNARQLGCVFQDMKPPKSILRKNSDLQKPIQRVKFTKAIARHTKIREQNPSLGYVCPGEPHQRSPNAPKFEDYERKESYNETRFQNHRVALDWLFDRINLDPKIQIKCSDTKNQLADMLTKGNFTRDERNHSFVFV